MSRIVPPAEFISITVDTRPTHKVHLLWEHDQPDTVCGELFKPEPQTRGTLLELCMKCAGPSLWRNSPEPNIVRGRD